MTGLVLFPCIQVVKTLVRQTLVLRGAVAGGSITTGRLRIGTDRFEFLVLPVTAIYLQSIIAKLSEAHVPRKMH